MSYIEHTQSDIQAMLKVIGVKSIDDLFESIPAEVRTKHELDLPPPLSELEVASHVMSLAERNRTVDKMPCFLGAGAYNHFIPAVIDHLAGRAEFYTAYTPYQAEASQGTLQAIFEYQTMMCELLGMDISNASLYDGATALAEAVLMSMSARGKNRIILSATIHPEYRQVVRTYLSDIPSEIIEIPFADDGLTDLKSLKKAVNADTACVAFQMPNFFGLIEEAKEISDITHKAGVLLVAVVDPISLGILAPPGEYGADIAVGDAQALGNPLSYGGPHLGFMCAREEFVRRMPGRLIGQARDADGKRGFVMTLQTREQHIRREKATSNICTNQALNALRATIYLAALGKQGIQKVANLCLQKAHYAAERITSIPGFKLTFSTPFFKEFAVKTQLPPSQINEILLKEGIIGGFALGRFYPNLVDSMLFCVTECNTKEQIDRLVDVLSRA